ncbi:hypothetical protein CAPTEDRAFT_171486 [Capitella teleta]|uniref:Uncharacterized protein n=1 Tax=Capitella teleta TaxID=283909 RepID=R7VHC2_CAPTE|nr:hypothetical protein CAPTEDRAFT_171486 [Capitella teleta]|eukprot:ELU18223.1 hypothetical protein CAPTEDRAFT_171486 [Capitella teleta]
MSISLQNRSGSSSLTRRTAVLLSMNSCNDDFSGSDYVPSVEPSVLASVKEELARKEEQQKKHYFYLSELQNMAQEMPAKYQQRLPYDLLNSLAGAVIDGTVFEIVRSLKEVQLLEERNLSTQRMKILSDQKAQKQELQKKHRDALQQCPGRTTNVPFIKDKCRVEMQAFEARCEDALRRKDMKSVSDLDQQLSQQQSTLERAGVPGFHVTNDSTEIRLQMYLLDFISRLPSPEEMTC